jgi:hypothetical protein
MTFTYVSQNNTKKIGYISVFWAGLQHANQLLERAIPTLLYLRDCPPISTFRIVVLDTSTSSKCRIVSLEHGKFVDRI